MFRPEPAVTALAETELEGCRRLFELGDSRQVVLALRWCVLGQLPLPDWLAPEASAAVEFYFAKGGAEGQGKRGGNLKRFERAQVHRRRHQLAERELARRAIVGGTRGQAFERAAEALSGTAAQGEPEQIRRSHEKVQRELRRIFRPPQ